MLVGSNLVATGNKLCFVDIQVHRFYIFCIGIGDDFFQRKSCCYVPPLLR